MMIDNLMASSSAADPDELEQPGSPEKHGESRYGITITGSAKVVVIYGNDIEVRMDGPIEVSTKK